MGSAHPSCNIVFRGNHRLSLKDLHRIQIAVAATFIEEVKDRKKVEVAAQGLH